MESCRDGMAQLPCTVQDSIAGFPEANSSTGIQLMAEKISGTLSPTPTPLLLKDFT